MSDFPPGRPTILEQGEKHAKDLGKVKTDAPSKFVVGGTYDGHRVQGGISYDRRWYNGLGLTAYAHGFWTDQPIIPTDKFGYVIGGEGSYTFRPKRGKPTP